MCQGVEEGREIGGEVRGVGGGEGSEGAVEEEGEEVRGVFGERAEERIEGLL